MKKKRKNHKKILYLKWLEEHKEAAELAEISEKVRVDKDKIIVKKESTMAKMLDYFVNGLIVFIKIAVVLVFMALISLAVTVLINPTLRETVFATIKEFS